MITLSQMDSDETIPNMEAVSLPNADLAFPNEKAVQQKSAGQKILRTTYPKHISNNGIQGNNSSDRAIPKVKQMKHISNNGIQENHYSDRPTLKMKQMKHISNNGIQENHYSDRPTLKMMHAKHVGGSSTEDIPTLLLPAITALLPAIVVRGETKKAQKKNLMGFAIRAVVTVLLFAFLLKSMNWSTLISTLVHVRHTSLLMGMATGVLCIIFSAYGWRCVVLAENLKTDLARLIELYLVGIGFSHFLPTNMGGDAIKVFYLGRDSGNMTGAASAALMSRITSFMGMLLIALPGLVIFHKYFTPEIIIEFILLSLLLIGAILGAFLTVVLLPKLSRSFLKKTWANKPLVVKFLKVGEALFATVKRPRSMISAILFGMLFWIASFLNYYGYAAALGVHVPLAFYVVAIPFVSIIASLPISINGFGVRESAFVYLFSTIHVSTSTATLLALLMDAQVLLFGLIGGCIYFTMNKEKK